MEIMCPNLFVALSNARPHSFEARGPQRDRPRGVNVYLCTSSRCSTFWHPLGDVWDLGIYRWKAGSPAKSLGFVQRSFNKREIFTIIWQSKMTR